MSKKPSERYSTESKIQYRRDIWESILGAYSKSEISKMDIAFLSGPQGAEIDVLLSMGADPKRLHAIDEVAANVASSTRRNKVRVNTYGCKLSKAAGRIAKKGIKIDAANLDFCGNITSKLLSEVEAFLPVLANNAHLAVTYFKGREPREASTLIRVVGGRRKALEFVLNYREERGSSVEFVNEGEYQNGRAPMAWHVWWISRITFDRFVAMINLACIVRSGNINNTSRATHEDKERNKAYGEKHFDPVLTKYGATLCDDGIMDISSIPSHKRKECLTALSIDH